MISFKNRPHTYDDIPLSVSGTFDSDECTVSRVTAADSKVDIFNLFAVNVLCLIGDEMHEKLLAEAAQENDEARAEINQWHREFQVPA